MCVCVCTHGGYLISSSRPSGTAAAVSFLVNDWVMTACVGSQFFGECVVGVFAVVVFRFVCLFVCLFVSVVCVCL